MANVLNLSLEDQNQINAAQFASMISDNKHFAEESGENVAEYFLRDFDANPDGWNLFEHSYDEISSAAKKERRNVIERMLASEGFVIES